MKEINNAVARFWKRSELNQTVKQAKANGLTVIRDKETTEIINPENGDVVLRSLYSGTTEIVRYNKTYFE